MRKQGLDLRVIGSLLAVVVIAGVVVLIVVGGSSGSSAKKTAGAVTYDAAGLLTPVREAPPLELRNYLGHPVNIASYRGKAVFVTFLYTHCPDVCPLITSQLRVAQNLMGSNIASKAEIIAVSVDPRGDTRATVASFLARHGMAGRMQYLIGSQQELAAAWKAWGVGAERDVHNPDLVEHSGLIYGITGSGKRVTIYAASFQPAEIAHDVPLLAAN